jgi:pimeloyl-ACP methyl ester carboxylesterase
MRRVIEHDVTPAPGRTLRVREYGDPSGIPVMTLHGNPGAGIPGGDDIARAYSRGIRLIAYDRPGYGSSTRVEGRNVADCARDIRAIAGALEIRAIAVWGLSGGGPHAAACAALLDDLVPAVAMLASPAPYNAQNLDYFAGMSENTIATVKQMLEDPPAAHAALEGGRRAIIAGGIDEMLSAMRSTLPGGDAALLAGETGAAIRARWLTGLASSADGWWDDMLATVSNWGFDVSQIRTEVLILHGREDPIVPVAHGEWLADAIPGAKARLLAGEGHFSLLGHPLDEAYDWMLERMP